MFFELEFRNFCFSSSSLSLAKETEFFEFKFAALFKTSTAFSFLYHWGNMELAQKSTGVKVLLFTQKKYSRIGESDGKHTYLSTV